VEPAHYCSRCETTKTRQVEQDETCLDAYRQCGTVEGVWLQPLLRVPPAPLKGKEPLPTLLTSGVC
jgi:hypothetical protein